MPAASHPGNKPKEEQVQRGSSPEKAAADKPPAEKAADSCPAGKWRYDYGDAFMRSFMEKNMKGAKVVKSEGSYICQFPSGKGGTASCAAVGGPVINDVAVNRAGLKMVVHAEIRGGSELQVEIADGKIKVLKSDLSKLDMKASATLNGNEIPVPLDDLTSFIPAGESQMAYKCEGDTLSLLIEAEGIKSYWQKLTRAK